MKAVIVAQDTRWNGKDFALTPYITVDYGKWNGKMAYTIGICWGYFDIGFVFGPGVKGMKFFNWVGRK